LERRPAASSPDQKSKIQNQKWNSPLSGRTRPNQTKPE
jgi:hypothetical protein